MAFFGICFVKSLRGIFGDMFRQEPPWHFLGTSFGKSLRGIFVDMFRQEPAWHFLGTSFGKSLRGTFSGQVSEGACGALGSECCMLILIVCALYVVCDLLHFGLAYMR